jgi:hypothetical protein
MTFQRLIDARSGQVLSDENATLIQQAHAHIKAVADEAGVDLALGDHQNATATATPGTVMAPVQHL